MIHRCLGLAGLLLTSACVAPPPPLTAAQQSARTDCRLSVDREYAAQNRADLTRRDERDSAFSGSYDPGISSRGLGAEYAREQSFDSCLRQNAAGPDATPGVGPAFSPAARPASPSRP